MGHHKKKGNPRKSPKLGTVDPSLSKTLKPPGKVKEPGWMATIKKQGSVKILRKIEPMIVPREIDKHLQNIREILLHSNANPIRCYDGRGYACSFCACSYPNLPDLKSHTFLHTEAQKKQFGEGTRTTASYTVKLDVTSLQCLLCKTNIEGLERLIVHLIQEHERKLFLDIKNQIIPLSFANDSFVCVVCAKMSQSYKQIVEHMNSHYGNFVCEICNTPFMTEKTMMSHFRRHEQGDFDCPVCGKIFVTARKRDFHVQSIHEGIQKRSKCRICFEMFTTHKKKMDHLVEVHGAKPLVYKCLACEKSFPSRAALTKHTKKDHLMERRHVCPHCGKKFFEGSDMRTHMVKHTGAREYQCDVCLKSYGRKDTLRGHMRIHADERRFKCDKCDQAFVQKCSWKSHMRSKHGEEV